MNYNFLLIASPTELAEHMRLNDLDNHQLNIALRNVLNQLMLLQEKAKDRLGLEQDMGIPYSLIED